MSDEALANKVCIPCRGGVPPLEKEKVEELLKQLDKSWEVQEGHHLYRLFTFDDFVSALAFTNKVGQVAEANGHHPDIHLTWGKVGIQIWTHKIDGLTESDFVLAAKIDQL